MQYTLNTKSFKIYQNNKITVALKKLNTLNPPILFVVNNKDQFVGTVTDGDIRRYILNKKNLNNNIKKGEKFSINNIGLKRPGYGISGKYYFKILKKISKYNFKKDELIKI